MSFFSYFENSREVTLSMKSHFPEVSFLRPGKSNFSGILFSREGISEIQISVKSVKPWNPDVTFSRKSNFHRKLNFPGSRISWEVSFSGKSRFPCPGKSNLPGSHNSREMLCCKENVSMFPEELMLTLFVCSFSSLTDAECWQRGTYLIDLQAIATGKKITELQ